MLWWLLSVSLYTTPIQSKKTLIIFHQDYRPHLWLAGFCNEFLTFLLVIFWQNVVQQSSSFCSCLFCDLWWTPHLSYLTTLNTLLQLELWHHISNLTSLSQRCKLRRVTRSRISSSCLLDRLFNDCRLSSLLLQLSHSWQVSTLNLLKLKTSFSSLLNIFLKVEKLITGPLCLFFKLFVVKWGCSQTNSDHIWRIKMLESKYFLHPLLALL